MGGLITKKMLMLAESDDKYSSVVDNTKGVVFYSKPHTGSEIENLKFIKII